MMEVSLWMLVLVLMQSDGKIATQQMDIFGHLDDCMYAADMIVAGTEVNRPYNWDFVCLEMDTEGSL